MNRINIEQIVRFSITLAILFSGLALLPFVDMPAGAIGWESLAGVYSPDLTAAEDGGAPGSRFAFSGSGYPPHRQATVYVNGEPVGEVVTDAGGGATFVLNTVGADPGLYNITLEVDGNASATTTIELLAQGTTVTPPAGFAGPTFYIGETTLMPIIYR